MASLHAVGGGDDIVLVEYAGAAHVIDDGADHQTDAALPRPRVTPSLHATDDASQRHLRRDCRDAAGACVIPRLRHDVCCTYDRFIRRSL